MDILKQKKTQQYILESAFKRFVDKGYDNTTMDDIVNSCGMSKGAIYHYYKSKKDLFIDLIDHWEIYAFPNFYKDENDKRTAKQTLIDFGEEILNAYKTKRYVFIAEIEFWALANRDVDIRDKSKLLYEKILKLFESVLRKGVKNGEFKKNNTKITAMSLLSLLQGINWFCVFESSNVNSSASEYIKTSIKQIIESIELKD